MRFDSFVGGSYTLSSYRADCQRSMNQYVELDESKQGINYGRMVGTPGLVLFKDLTKIDDAAHPVRGMWSGAGRMFVAAGTKYFEIDSTGALVGMVKTIADDASHTPVQFFANGQQLALIASGNLYVDNPLGAVQPTMALTLGGQGDTYTIWAGGGSLARHTDGTGGLPFTSDLIGKTITIAGSPYVVYDIFGPDFLGVTPDPGTHTNVSFSYSSTVNVTATNGTYLDGYLIITRPPSGTVTNRQFNISGLNDFLSWDQLDFDIKSGYPDQLVSVLADHQELWLFGAETIEIWRDTGNADFPFQRDPSAVIHFGCGAPWSPIGINGKVAWIDVDSRGAAVAYISTGFVPQRVSTSAVEEAWRSCGFPMKFATSFQYFHNGHYFWVITLAGTRTWVYDSNTQIWHERAYLVGGVYNDDSNLSSAKYGTHTFIPEWDSEGRHIVGSWSDGKLYYLTEDADGSGNYADAGDPIYRERTCPHIVVEHKNIFMHRFEVYMDTGSGIGGTVQPTVQLSISRNGDIPFGNSMTLNADIRSDPPPRVIFRQLGKARDFVARFAVTGKSKYSAYDAYLEKTDGTA